ncbi:hypothetical protein F4801DRAFT_583315 [Xylaria longipes]|nr:hypothetical protein F4801DRAFT_583315 [Xylaria longipes]
MAQHRQAPSPYVKEEQHADPIPKRAQSRQGRADAHFKKIRREAASLAGSRLEQRQRELQGSDVFHSDRGVRAAGGHWGGHWGSPLMGRVGLLFWNPTNPYHAATVPSQAGHFICDGQVSTSQAHGAPLRHLRTAACLVETPNACPTSGSRCALNSDHQSLCIRSSTSHIHSTRSAVLGLRQRSASAAEHSGIIIPQRAKAGWKLRN